jgi:hypothetical protein
MVSKHNRRGSRGILCVRWLLVAGALVMCLAPAGIAQAHLTRGAIGTELEQCQNGTNGLTDCTGTPLSTRTWSTGDINPLNSLYREGDFVPFRVTITGLTSGADYTLRIGYDAVEAGLHAYDYLGSVDGSRAPGQRILPCDGVAGTAGEHACGTGSTPGPPSTLAVPIDTNTHFPSGRSQLPGVFSAWGGKLKSAAYVSPTPINAETPGAVERQIDVTFTAEGPTVVLAWGGHLASSLDWGAGNTFLSAHSGASFHMRLLSINGESTGHEDRSLHGSVLAPTPSEFTTQVQPSSATVGHPVIDTATLVGTSGVVPAGSVGFWVCFDASTTPNCNTGGELKGLETIVASLQRAAAHRGHRHARARAHRGHRHARAGHRHARAGHRHARAAAQARAGSTGQAAFQFVPEMAGHYCFRVEYMPAPGVPYSPLAHTDTTTECFEATLPPPSLTVTKICVPPTDSGLFNLLINSAIVLANAPCGHGTGPTEQQPGTHTVGESAGTGTNLPDYTTIIGGNCAANGTISLVAGQSATCTITNVRGSTPIATLTVNKVCVPTTDSGRFQIFIDGIASANVPCGGSTGPVTLPAGMHTVSEQGGENTHLNEYSTVIGGACAANGTITLAAGGSATCTITNTRLAPQPATITVTKACLPTNDPGRFNLTINGAVAGTGANVPCGGTTGAVQVEPGLHTVGETAAPGTDLGNYTETIGGDCAPHGAILVAPGEQATCTITNVRNPEPSATLTVDKICVPANDGGLFNLSIGEHTEANEPCGGRIGPLAVPVGTQKVGETAGTGTNLADYTTTIGGACAADGSITLTNGESAICTITNVRKQPPPEPPPTQTATLEVKKICVPANDTHRFTLRLDTELLPLMGCGESTGPMETATGAHVVGELASGTNPADYETLIGGDCAANGSITLTANEKALCTVTNVRKNKPHPPTPPTVCNTLTAAPRRLTVGKHSMLIARVLAAGRPVHGAAVRLAGLGISHSRMSGADGTARFAIRPSRAGFLVLSTERQFGCPAGAKSRVGVAAAHRPKRPVVTG